jgi:hypothetical protein
MHKLIEDDKYDLRLQASNVAEKLANFNRHLASEWEYLDDYALRAFAGLVAEVDELAAMINHIKSRKGKAA